MAGWWCGACGQPYDWRKPNRLFTLQFGDTSNAQEVFPAYGAPDGESDNTISALKLVTNLIKGSKLGVEAKGFNESSKNRLVEALATIISVDRARTLVMTGEVAQFKLVHDFVLASF